MQKQVCLSLLICCLGLPTTVHGFLARPLVPATASLITSGRRSSTGLGKLVVDKDTTSGTALFDKSDSKGDVTQSSSAQQDEAILRELMEEMKIFEEQLATVEDELATMRKEWSSLADKSEPLPSGKHRSSPASIWTT